MHKLPSRRALLAGAPAAAAAALAGGTVANAVAIGMAKAGDVDPALVAIANHVAALRQWFDAFDREEESEVDTAEFEAATEAINIGGEREIETALAVLTTMPTTLAGVAALLEHVGQHEYLEMDSGGDNEIFETLLSSWGNQRDGRKTIAQDFSLHLAAALRNIIERGQA
jgi:hypothetical protein